jgi:hypothetical protein
LDVTGQNEVRGLAKIYAKKIRIFFLRMAKIGIYMEIDAAMKQISPLEFPWLI